MLYGNKEVTFNPRLLPERSYLYYKYPQRSTERSIEFYFPILENLEIAETQRPNLGVYDILGRPGNLFSYHGSKSREFSIKFFITLPNLIDHINNVGLNAQFSDSFRYFYSERELNRRMFLKQQERVNWETLGMDPGASYNDIYYKNSISKYDSFLPPKNELDSLLEQLSQFTNALKIPVFENPAQILNLFKKERPRVLKNAISYFMLLINVVRTSTINNSSNTSLSPPTIYINHGTMYNNIPCVCTNYNLRIVSENGYELKNMNPRRVEVTMNLSENRTGNFGDFIPWSKVIYTIENAENITGWESILNHRTMDPWNSTFGEYDSDLVNLTAWEAENARLEEQVRQARLRQEEGLVPAIDTTDFNQYLENNLVPISPVNDDPVQLDDPLDSGLLKREGFTDLNNPYAKERNEDYNIKNQNASLGQVGLERTTAPQYDASIYYNDNEPAPLLYNPLPPLPADTVLKPLYSPSQLNSFAFPNESINLPTQSSPPLIEPVINSNIPLPFNLQEVPTGSPLTNPSITILEESTVPRGN
jgi:hypothetical protein